MNESLESLRTELANRRGSITKIANQSGISYSWLMQFTHGKIVNPTVKRVEALRNALYESPPEDRAA